MSVQWSRNPDQPDTPDDQLAAARAIVNSVLACAPFWATCLGIALWTIYG